MHCLSITIPEISKTLSLLETVFLFIFRAEYQRAADIFKKNPLFQRWKKITLFLQLSSRKMI